MGVEINAMLETDIERLIGLGIIGVVVIYVIGVTATYMMHAAIDSIQLRVALWRMPKEEREKLLKEMEGDKLL